MKNWNEVSRDDTVYVVNPIEYEDEDGVMRNTKPYQKCTVDAKLDDCIAIVVDDGIAEGYDFYFYYNESKPEELLTEEEFKSCNAEDRDLTDKIKDFLTRNKIQYEQLVRCVNFWNTLSSNEQSVSMDLYEKGNFNGCGHY